MRGTAPLADYQAAIQSITYRQSTPSPGSREFLLIPTSASYSVATGNLYQLVNTGAPISWQAARSAANAVSLESASGHLVNITSQSENDFVMSLLSSATWTGGTDEAAEGTWLWADGPEAGQQLWSGPQESSGGASVDGMFDSWAASEPNNAGAGEHYIGVVPGSGLWLDYPANHGDVRTYTVEFEQSDFSDLLVRVTLTIGPVCVSPLAGDYADTSGAQGSIGRLYMATFSRQPDAGGFSYWTERMDNGYEIWDIADFFAESPEFESTFGSPEDSEFVDHLYENIMCRPGDTTGKQFWHDQLASGTLARTDILLLFADSPEFRELTESD